MLYHSFGSTRVLFMKAVGRIPEILDDVEDVHDTDSSFQVLALVVPERTLTVHHTD